MPYQTTAIAQKQNADGSWVNLSFVPFAYEDENLAGFLANIRNLNGEHTTLNPSGDLPHRGNRKDTDLTGDDDAFDQPVTLSLSTLTGYDYAQTFEVTTDTTIPNADRVKSLRDLLGPQYFADIQTLELMDAERVQITFTPVV